MPLTVEQYQEYLRSKAQPPPAQAQPEGTDLLGAFQAGFRESPTGMLMHGIPQPGTEDYDFWEKVAKGIGSFADPISVAMFALGGGIGGGVARGIGQKAVVSMLTKAGAKAALKEFGVKAATTGITNATAFGLYDAGKEGIRQAVSGERDPRKVLAEGVKGVVIGAATGPAGGLPGKGLVAATGRLAGEAAGLTGAGAFVEGRKPTAEDLLVNAATLGVLKGTGAAVGKALPKRVPKEPASMPLSDAPLKPPAPEYGKTTPLRLPKERPQLLTATEGFIGDAQVSVPAFTGDKALRGLYAAPPKEFGQSAVKETVYHGSPTDTIEFFHTEPGKTGANTGAKNTALGAFFSDAPDIAKGAAYGFDPLMAFERSMSGAPLTMYTVKLNMRRPLDLNNLKKADIDALEAEFPGFRDRLAKVGKDKLPLLKFFASALTPWKDVGNFRDWVKAKGLPESEAGRQWDIYRAAIGPTGERLPEVRDRLLREIPEFMEYKSVSDAALASANKSVGQAKLKALGYDGIVVKTWADSGPALGPRKQYVVFDPKNIFIQRKEPVAYGGGQEARAVSMETGKPLAAPKPPRALRQPKPIIKLGDDRVGRVFDEMPKAEGGEGAFRKLLTDWVSKTEPLGVFRRRLAKKGSTMLMEADPEVTTRMEFANADLNGARFFDANIAHPILRGLSDADHDILRQTAFSVMVKENRKVDPKRFNDYTIQRLGTSIERVNEAVATMDSYRTADGRTMRQVIDAIGRKGTGATWRDAVETRGTEWAERAFGEKDYYFPIHRRISGRKIGTYGEPDLLSDPVRNLTGLGELKIEDPLISILGQSMAQRRYAAEQKAIGQMLDLADQNNWPDLAQVLKKGQANLPGEYSYKGQVVRLDPEIARSLIAMQGGGWGRLDFVQKWATMPTKVLRKGVTLAPEFWIRNIFRDVYSATIMSRYGFTPVDFVKGFSSAIKQDQHFKDWVGSNGPSATWVSMDKNMLMTEYTRMLRGEGGKGAAKYIVQHPLEVAAMMSELAENATRIGAHRKAKAKGATQIQAGFESRDISVDFKRSGVYGQVVNQLVPFWNANIQGWDKFTRTFIRDLKSDPKRAGVAWLKAGTMVTAPSVALALLNSRDPRWRDIPDWQKNAFWIVMTDDHIWRIPKPFELGLLFGSVPERFAEYVVSKDPTQLEAIMSSLGRNVGDVGGVNPMDPSMAGLAAQVQPIGPAVEVMANRNTFTGGPVVPKSVEHKPPAYQKAKWTRRTFVELGQRLGYSPAKLEYLWEGYSGTLGKYAADTSDAVLNALDPNDGPPKPKQGWSEVPFIRAFVVRHPSGGGRLVNKYYDLVADNEAKWSVRQDLRGRERADVERVHRVSLAYQKLIKGSWERIERVEQSRTMTPEAKRVKIDAEYYRINRLAEQALGKIRR